MKSAILAILFIAATAEDIATGDGAGTTPASNGFTVEI